MDALHSTLAIHNVHIRTIHLSALVAVLCELPVDVKVRKELIQAPEFQYLVRTLPAETVPERERLFLEFVVSYKARFQAKQHMARLGWIPLMVGLVMGVIYWYCKKP